MQHCESRIGNAYFRTPRETIMPFINLLAVLEQNPAADWRLLIGQIEITPEQNPDLAPLEEDTEGEQSLQPVAAGSAEAAGSRVASSPSSGSANDDLTQFKL